MAETQEDLLPARAAHLLPEDHVIGVIQAQRIADATWPALSGKLPVRGRVVSRRAWLNFLAETRPTKSHGCHA
jgi:hypothetical protein